MMSEQGKIDQLLIFIILSQILAIVSACQSPSPEYSLLNGLYYKVNTSLVTFMEARENCRAEGARLMEFKTEQLYYDAKSKANQAGNTVWVNMFNRDLHLCDSVSTCNGTFYWGDDSKVYATSAWTGLDGNGAQACLRMEPNGYIGDKDCFELFGFVCQYDCNDPYPGPQATCPTTGDLVPSGYDEFNGHHYKWFLQYLSYTESEAVCTQDGAYLVEFSNYNLYTSAKYMKLLNPIPNIHVGLTNPTLAECFNELCNDVLYWADGTPFVYNSTFMADVTATGASECMSMAENFIVIETNCSLTQPFICHFDCSAGPIIHGNWSAWSEWSGCIGMALESTRTRTCTNPAPNLRGDTCVGDNIETVECPSVWSEWSAWSDCPNHCLASPHKRIRYCSRPDNCTGDSMQVDYCPPELVPVKCLSNDTFKMTHFFKHLVDSSALDFYIANAVPLSSVDLSDIVFSDVASHCARHCNNIKQNPLDFETCNSYVINGDFCYFGFLNVSLVPSLPQGNLELFLDINLA